ncbi:MAG TPA: transporter suffix domain-containing protein [Victivallales bacterium]|nr:transporter suffix domain-containing protein [Victivallales bacterium]
MDLKLKVGFLFIILSFILPVFSFFVPMMNLPTYISGALIGILVLGGPEVCIILGVMLAGKEAVKNIKSKIFRSAGKIRYMTGLLVFLFCFFANLILAYLELIKVINITGNTWLHIMSTLDIVSILSILAMGPEFFFKIKRIFKWEGPEFTSTIE